MLVGEHEIKSKDASKKRKGILGNSLITFLIKIFWQDKHKVADDHLLEQTLKIM